MGKASIIVVLVLLGIGYIWYTGMSNAASQNNPGLAIGTMLASGWLISLLVIVLIIFALVKFISK